MARAQYWLQCRKRGRRLGNLLSELRYLLWRYVGEHYEHRFYFGPYPYRAASGSNDANVWRFKFYVHHPPEARFKAR